jgi:GNAT superfamily N-acetyltransferase
VRPEHRRADASADPERGSGNNAERLEISEQEPAMDGSAQAAVEPDLIRLAETSEAESLYQLIRSTTAETRERMRLAVERIGGGVVVAAGNDTSRFWSRALSLGLHEPLTAEVLAAAVELATAQAAPRLVFQVAPALLPPDWADTVGRFGLTPGTTWYKMACPADAFVADQTELQIARTTSADADAAAAALADGFGFDRDDTTGIYAAALAGTAPFSGFAAWDAGTIVATAALAINGDCAQMCGAATLPEHRGRGAQSGLPATRAAAARDHGCRWLVVETYVPAEPGANPSYNNMLRTGFRTQYKRPSWVWTRD